MNYRHEVLHFIIVVLILLGTTLSLPAVTASVGADVLTVGDDGDADYTSIQAAVNAADKGDTVHVYPGVYTETVTVEKSVSLVAPQGASIDCSTMVDATAVTLEAGADMSGLTIQNCNVGVDGAHQDNWVLRNVTIRNASWMAVAAGGSEGDWELRNVTIVNVDQGISAPSTSGNWTVTDTVIRNMTQGHAIDTATATGNWTLENVSIQNGAWVGVEATYTSGDWDVKNTTIRNTTVGIAANKATGEWTVRRSAVVDTTESERYDFPKPPLKEGVGIYAPRTNGSWVVTQTRFAGNDQEAIAAPGASPVGNATTNTWRHGDATSPEGCSGNVDCGGPVDDPMETSTEDANSTPSTKTPSATGAAIESNLSETPSSPMVDEPSSRSPQSAGDRRLPMEPLFDGTRLSLVLAGAVSLAGVGFLLRRLRAY